MKIYTRTGDAGTTSLVGGTRVKKTCSRLEAYGTVDELNSHIGLLMSLCHDAERDFLLQVQQKLFVLGSYLATEGDKQPKCSITEGDVAAVEQQIDAVSSTLPKLHFFVLPSGTQAASQCHVCRTVCRRAERRVLALAETAPVDALATAYINRLSDYFFVLARHLNVAEGQQELTWDPKKS